MDVKKTLKMIGWGFKYEVPKIIIGTAAVFAVTSFPPAIPAVLAVGAIASYIKYKRKNPKATIKHFTKNGLKNQRNKLALRFQMTNVAQATMQAQKAINRKKQRQITTNQEPVFTDNAQTAIRLIRKQTRLKWQKVERKSER